MDDSRHKNILVCDDNALNRKLITAMLNGLPYRVRETTNGRETLDYALTEHSSIDLVLLDISMNDISGIEVCRAIRSSDLDRICPLTIIAYTAHAMIDELERYISAGFDDVLTKPTTREALFSILRKHTT